ncbi:MAG TPA: enoyl-CoA hydratase-related protein [Gemmatimonadales bacterium]
MSTDRVLDTLDDGVLTLTLNRPEKRNALDGAMIHALTAHLERADLDVAVRVVAVRGSGSDFCAGADLTELLASADRSLAENREDAARLGAVFTRMRALPKPVVAIVHGRALAGGCGLATACDLTVARDDATFGYPEVRRGFVPAMVMTMLRRATSERVAFDLVATGRSLDATEAVRCGLVARVFPAAGFEDSVAAFLGLLRAASPSALALIKQQLYALDVMGFDAGVRLGAEVNAVARQTPDFREAIERFLRQ